MAQQSLMSYDNGKRPPPRYAGLLLAQGGELGGLSVVGFAVMANSDGGLPKMAQQ